MKVTRIYAGQKPKCPYCGFDPATQKCGHLRFIEDGEQGITLFGRWNFSGFLKAFVEKLDESEFEKEDDRSLEDSFTSMIADGVIDQVEHPDIEEVVFHFTFLDGPGDLIICYNAVNMYGFGKILLD